MGLSTGLSYMPGLQAGTEEVSELAGIAGRWGGIYATHLRSHDRGLEEAIREAVTIGRANRMPVEISHIKLMDEDVWGDLDRITRPLEEARRLGVEVTLDLYPYTAAFMGLTNSFPEWSREGGPARFAARLNDPELLERIKSSVIETRFPPGRGTQALRSILISECPRFPRYEGLTVEDILGLKGRRSTPGAAAELLIDLERNGGATALFFQMTEEDVEALIRMPKVMIASDAGLVAPGTAHPHPRSFGAFPRVIGRYVRDKRLLTLEEAVRKMTSLPADVLGLRERGRLRQGLWADIVIFDPVVFEDAATYDHPRRIGPGLSYVLVNGEIVVEAGRATGKKPGRILYGPAQQGGRA